MTAWRVLDDGNFLKLDAAGAEVQAILADASGSLRRVAADVEVDYETWTAQIEDVCVLGAAQLALATATAPQVPLNPFERQPFNGQFAPTPAMARIAFFKVDCSGTRACRPSEAADRPLWDVLLFGGDVAKLTSAGATTVGKLNDSFFDIFDEYVSLLDSSGSVLQPLPGGAIPYVEGLLWRALATVSVGGDDSDVRQRTLEFLERYDLGSTLDFS